MHSIALPNINQQRLNLMKKTRYIYSIQTPMSKINAFSKSQYVRSLTRTENTKRQSLSLPSLSGPISSRATHHAADCRSCPSPATPTLAACRPAGAAPHPHPLLISSPPPHLQAINLEFSLTLEIGLPAGVEDDGPQFGSPPILPCH
jgi:hypothetical protein